ncbi:MAG: alpha/beta hydrolase [Pseudomonadota bacterium]|nr:alpha/beta hydrolase [Pseudomonadota bacterium]
MSPDPTPIDPDLARLLPISRHAGYPPFEAMTPKAARSAYSASIAAVETAPLEVASVRDLTIPGPGGPLPLRIYRGLGTGDANLPWLLFLHGGGWVIGGLDTHDRQCRRLASRGRICVVAVDYRLAPEHPFPAALDDAVAALRWVHAEAGALGITADAVGVGGDSAGGNLAAALALLSRDGGMPSVAFQALLYPALDLTASTESYRRMTSGVPLTAATMRWFIGHYAPRESDRVDRRVSPLRANSVAGVAPALVLTVAHDPLCDEGRAYAGRLEQEGVRVIALHHDDQMHGLFGLGRYVPVADLVADHVAALVGHELRGAAARMQ